MLTRCRPQHWPRQHDRWPGFLVLAALLLFSPQVLAAGAGELDLTYTLSGFIAVTLFILAYALVMAEEKLHMRKSKPVLVAAGLIWTLIGWVYVQEGLPDAAEHAFKETLLEYTELLLFLLVAMTYVNAMEERRVFDQAARLDGREGLQLSRPVLDHRHSRLLDLHRGQQPDHRHADVRGGAQGGRR